LCVVNPASPQPKDESPKKKTPKKRKKDADEAEEELAAEPEEAEDEKPAKGRSKKRKSAGLEIGDEDPVNKTSAKRGPKPKAKTPADELKERKGRKAAKKPGKKDNLTKTAEPAQG